MIDLFNMDCMEYMAGCEDNAFDLAIVDPPYGIGEDGGKFRDRKGRGNYRVFESKGWDAEPPKEEYFAELERVSTNRIIWGANHFANRFDASSSGWIYWDKRMGGDFADGELAYTSFNKALKSYSQCNKAAGRIHPCEKPVKLYSWLLENYADTGKRILDTHLGSGSSAIAAHYFGCDFVGTELDPDYFKAAQERFDNETKQAAMF